MHTCFYAIIQFFNKILYSHAATGCRQLQLPPSVDIQAQGNDRMTAMCNSTGERWFFFCDGSHWTGDDPKLAERCSLG